MALASLVSFQEQKQEQKQLWISLSLDAFLKAKSHERQTDRRVKRDTQKSALSKRFLYSNTEKAVFQRVKAQISVVRS